MRIILTGKLAGKTVSINRHQFVNGVLTLPGDASANAGAIRYLGRCHHAWPEGSEELKRVQKVRKDGVQCDADPTAQSGNPKSVQGHGVQPSGQVSTASANDGGADDSKQSPDGDAGMVSGGSGHQDAGLLPEQVKRIKDVLTELDPENDEFWTDTGLPSVEVVAQALADPTITRKALETVMPGFTREVSRANREL